MSDTLLFLALTAGVQALLAGVFVVPTLAVQGVAAWRRGPRAVLAAGVVGLAALALVVGYGRIACSAEPVWVESPDAGGGARPIHACDGPVGFVVYVFMILAAPVAALAIILGTVLLRRRAGGRLAAWAGAPDDGGRG